MASAFKSQKVTVAVGTSFSTGFNTGNQCRIDIVANTATAAMPIYINSILDGR